MEAVLCNAYESASGGIHRYIIYTDILGRVVMSIVYSRPTTTATNSRASAVKKTKVILFVSSGTISMGVA
jgi:hypothetical protein